MSETVVYECPECGDRTLCSHTQDGLHPTLFCNCDGFVTMDIDPETLDDAHGDAKTGEPINEYCPECGRADYDRYELDDGSAVVQCEQCGFTDQVRPPNPDEVNV